MGRDTVPLRISGGEGLRGDMENVTEGLELKKRSFFFNIRDLSMFKFFFFFG